MVAQQAKTAFLQGADSGKSCWSSWRCTATWPVSLRQHSMTQAKHLHHSVCLLQRILLTKSETKKMYKKSDPIFQCTAPSTGQIWGEVAVGTLYVPLVHYIHHATATSPHICPIDGVVHRNQSIGSDFLYVFFVSLLVNKILWNVRMRVTEEFR